MKGISNAMFSEFCEFIGRRLGLHFQNKRLDLERGIKSAAEEFGFNDAESCIEWLLASPLTKKQIEILASHLTVGETHFFRERRSFEVMEENILPELIGKRKEKYLRIWSAGCATGEEPYSIAILLSRIIPDMKNWNITILATDINSRFLQKASEGIYREWSFRDAPAWIKKYFNKTKNGYEILPEIKEMVTFSYHNLAEDTYPSLLNNTNAMDIIFCRNVLMYFDPEKARYAVENLYSCIGEEGWLIVNALETSNIIFSQFATVNFPDLTVYRKIPHITELIPPEPVSQPEEKIELAITAKAMFLLVRAYANQGKLIEALGWCEKAIAMDKLDPGTYYLRAMILQEMGHVDEAARSLRQALYLDPNYVMAHFGLGNILRRQGKIRESNKNFENSLALLQKFRTEEPLQDSDGITAGRLYEIISSMMKKEEILLVKG